MDFKSFVLEPFLFSVLRCEGGAVDDLLRVKFYIVSIC